MAEAITTILSSIKKALLLAKDYEEFDPEIIMHINSVFADLAQIGMGPDEAFEIEDDSAEWSDFLEDGDPNRNAVKSYMYLRVKLLFDPPATSFAIEAFSKQIAQFEWRFSIYRDSLDLKAAKA